MQMPMNMNNRKHKHKDRSRKQRETGNIIACSIPLLFFMSTHQPTDAFSIMSGRQILTHKTSHKTPYTFLSMQNPRNGNGNNSVPQSTTMLNNPVPLLDEVEERILLESAKVYDNLTTLKTELHLRMPKSTFNSSFQANEYFAREAGYKSMEELDEALEEGRMARDTLIHSNMGLVHSITKEILSCSKNKLQTLTYEDLIQEGSIGLSRSIEKFSLSHKTRFSTYAYYWIRAAILRALAAKNEYIRIPEHISNTVSKISKAVTKLGSGYENDLVQNWAWREVKEATMLAESVGENLEKVNKAMEVEKMRRNGMIVLMGEELQQGKVPKAGLRFEQHNIPEIDVNREEELKRVLFNYLKPKEAEALCLRYGLVGHDENFRDYEAEAEEDLFGPTGILSDPATSHQSSISTPTVSKSKTQKNGNLVAVNVNRTSPKRGKWGEAMTFKEIGRQMAMSAENGRRLCSVGLEKLRIAVEEGKLDPGLIY